MAEIKTKEELTGKVYASGKIIASLVSEKGAKGDAGAKGDSGTISIGEVKSGEIAEVTNSGTSTDAIFNFVLPKGEKGEPGEPGEKGADGTGVNILGTYESEEILKENHPTGNIGDAYMIGGSLYVWSVNDNTWINVGNIKGEKGEKGDKGEKGADGEKGTSGIVSQPNEPTDEDIVVWVDTDEEGEVLEISSYKNAIESITVNGEEQEIKEKNINIIVPTKTSDLTNDNNFISLENVPREVIVSSEEPTTGEKVWIQRGKNLISKNIFHNGYLEEATGEPNTEPVFDEMYSDFIEVEGNKTYTFAILKPTTIYSQWYGIAEYNSDKEMCNFINRITYEETYENKFITFTTTANTKFLRISARNLINATSVALEEGISLSPKKVYTKNDNGYEEFYNEENFNEKITNLTMDMANKLTKVFNRGAEGGSTLDTGLTISGGYGGGCYLVVNTWHLSGSAGGLKVSLLALPVESGTFKEYVVCDIKTNESYSKGFTLSVSENNTLKVYGVDGGAFHTTIYRL